MHIIFISCGVVNIERVPEVMTKYQGMLLYPALSCLAIIENECASFNHSRFEVNHVS